MMVVVSALCVNLVGDGLRDASIRGLWNNEWQRTSTVNPARTMATVRTGSATSGGSGGVAVRSQCSAPCTPRQTSSRALSWRETGKSDSRPDPSISRDPASESPHARFANLPFRKVWWPGQKSSSWPSASPSMARRRPPSSTRPHRRRSSQRPRNSPHGTGRSFWDLRWFASARSDIEWREHRTPARIAERRARYG